MKWLLYVQAFLDGLMIGALYQLLRHIGREHRALRKHWNDAAQNLLRMLNSNRAATLLHLDHHVMTRHGKDSDNDASIHGG